MHAVESLESSNTAKMMTMGPYLCCHTLTHTGARARMPHAHTHTHTQTKILCLNIKALSQNQGISRPIFILVFESPIMFQAIYLHF